MVAFDKDDTSNKVVDVVAEKLSVDKNTVTKASTFEDLGADSLDMVEIIMKCEEQFGIEINDEDAEKMNSLSDAISYIHERRTK